MIALNPTDFNQPLDPGAFAEYARADLAVRKTARILFAVIALGAALSLVFLLAGLPQTGLLPPGVWVDLAWLGVILLTLLVGLPLMMVATRRRNDLGLTAEDVRAARAQKKISAASGRIASYSTPSRPQESAAYPRAFPVSGGLQQPGHQATFNAPRAAQNPVFSAPVKSPSAKYCRNCGNPVKQGERFCSHCGAAV